MTTKTALQGFTSPLRYPGGKGMLANFTKVIVTCNDVADGHYVEVYAGGASIAWSLLFEEYVQHVHINDWNLQLFSFWSSVLNETESLCQLIQDTPITMEEWYRQKSVQSHPESHTTLELGFSTFYLNRTNRSGILNGGVIGGKSQQGTYKLDARFNKTDLIARIQRVARYSSRISLYRQDALQFLKHELPQIPQNSFIYLDPPYYVKGKGLYENHYQHKDHVEIAEQIKKIIQPWMVSYDNVPEIVELYRSYRSLEYGLSYSAQERYVGSEIIFFSNGLIVPSVADPSRVKLKMNQPSLFL